MPTLLIKNLRLGEVNKQVHVILTVKVSGLKLSDSRTRALSLEERIAWLWSRNPVNLLGGMEWGRTSCWDWGVQKHGVWEPRSVLFLSPRLSPRLLSSPTALSPPGSSVPRVLQ